MKKQVLRPRPTKRIFELKINLSFKNIIFWGLIFLFGLSFFVSLGRELKPSNRLPLSQILQDAKEEKIKKIEVENERLTAFYKDGKTATSYKEPQESLVKILEGANIKPESVEIEIKETAGLTLFINLLANFLPIILMIGFFLFLFRQAKGTQDNIFSFGQSRARLFSKNTPRVTFADVAGVDEAKEELKEVVDFLRHPEKYRALGARTPKGALLIGPSGTGKTLLARAVAGEAGVPFLSVAGSEFMEMLVGVGASRVRDLFANAKKSAPSIIFIDEIDAIGRMRSIGVMGGHDEREQTLNQILVEMDGFSPNEQVVVIAATNRGDLLDPALLRPGRFDRRVSLDMPDIEGRKAILSIHMRGKPFAAKVDWDKMAKRTVGFSGADLENMLNEAAILAARLGKKEIDMKDLEEAATKVKLGPEKKRLQSDLDRKITAYHEAGHAVVTRSLPHMDPVHRVSIVSRGLALGYTLIPPTKDRLHETRSHLLEQITAMLGGRAAEELIFNELTSGAAADIDKATIVAKEMVMEFGMSSLGPINFGPTIETSEWGQKYFQSSSLSQEMQAKVDQEVKKLIDSCYFQAAKILKDKKKKLDAIALELIKKETLEGEDFEKLMGK